MTSRARRPRSGSDGSVGPSDATGVPAERPAAAARRSYLVVFEEQTSRMVRLPSDGELVLGRADDADVQIDDAGASRRHAKLVVRGGVVELTDLGSQNGTYVNASPLAATRRLVSGDFIEIGAVGMTFHDGAPAAVGAAPPARDESPVRELEIGGVRVLVADAAMLRLYELVERLAASELPVLVCGETGAGKEILAGAVHAFSPRRAGPFVPLNCAAVQESLLESELFGHERGAFTGATATKPGLLEIASGGTVFLDEIGELASAAQAKLLRALDSKRITRLGDVRERPIDVRVVAATNRDLEREAREGRFRLDLYYRLSGATLWLPALRDRPRELALLARAFVTAACARLGRAPVTVSDAAVRRLAEHDFPGNVRELKNVVEYLVAAHPGAELGAEHVAARLAPRAEAAGGGFARLEDEVRELEKRRMREALDAAGGNQTRAAELVGMPLRTFVTKLSTYGLRPGRDRR